MVRRRRCRRSPAAGKSDASLFFGARDSGPDERRGGSDPDGGVDSDDRRRGAWRAGRAQHTGVNSTAGRGHTRGTDRRAHDSRVGRRESIAVNPRAPALRTRGLDNHRTGVRRRERRIARSQTCASARGSGVCETPDPHPSAPSAGTIYLKSACPCNSLDDGRSEIPRSVVIVNSQA